MYVDGIVPGEFRFAAIVRDLSTGKWMIQFPFWLEESASWKHAQWDVATTVTGQSWEVSGRMESYLPSARARDGF
jgi:hypothetical protein